MVPAGSPYGTIGELIAAWRAHPDRLTVGGGSQTGGPDHLMSMQLAEAVGIDPHQVSYVAHDGGGELLPALVGNEVDFAISGVREYTQQIRSGQLRVLAVSGDARVANLDAPTLTESGIPRGVRQLARGDRSARGSPIREGRADRHLQRSGGNRGNGRRSWSRTAGTTRC